MVLTRNLGMLLLGIWLIVFGLSQLIPGFAGLGLVLAIIAIIAGILIMLGR